MQRRLQGKRTELKKVGDPNANGSMHRSSYYCKVNFLLNKKAVDVVLNVDTSLKEMYKIKFLKALI